MKKRDIFIEESVELFVNGKRLITFMCTPENLPELALGHLYSKGIINDVDEVIAATPCSSKKRIFSLLDRKLDDETYTSKDVIMSGCGSGEISRRSKLVKREIAMNNFQNIEELKELFVKMLEEAKVHQTTGGTHSAAIRDHTGKILTIEDIGRHNAVDKIIGAALMEGLNLKSSVIAITGRISSDMVIKALGAGVSTIVSMRIASDMAIRIAEEFNINLIGRIGSKTPFFYTDLKCNR